MPVVALLLLGLLLTCLAVWATARLGDLIVIRRLEARRRARLATESMGLQVFKPGTGWVPSRS